ncbi:MAG: hypothetical protein J6Z31_07955 [Fibrobacter sp.]|nr:hypothetical protein [Fibrobacter sp.]
MPSSILEIECPMCHGTIVVDRDTGKVLEHKEFKKEKQSLEDFLAKEKTRTSDLDKKFAEAREREKNRLSEIEKKFEAAKNNPNLKDPPPTIQWD